MSQFIATLPRESTALVVIDVQERINGVMCDQGHLPRLEVLVEAFQVLERPMLVTEQYPKGLGSTVPALAELCTDQAMEKDTFSCFREDHFREAVARTGASHLVVTGIETHVCVLQTTLDLLAAGYVVHLPHDAVNSRRTADRDWALARMQQAGAIVSSTESALFELLERCGTDEFRALSKLVKKLPV